VEQTIVVTKTTGDRVVVAAFVALIPECLFIVAVFGEERFDAYQNNNTAHKNDHRCSLEY
jgi:hypothetical protein